MEFVTGKKKSRTLELSELLTGEMTGREVRVNGAVHVIRDMGNIAFIILRKREGLVQCVFEEGVSGFELKDVKEADAEKVEGGMTVRIGENEFTVQSVSAAPVAVEQGGKFSEYLLYVGGLQVGEWVYEVVLDGALADGVYGAEIVVDSVSPLSFVFN